MPIARDPRTDRRRRVFREVASEETPARRRRTNQKASDEEASPRRSAGYSQNVRGACGRRLVQLVPVRHRSYLAVVITSVLVPSLLLLGHYKVYVSNSWPWYGHPLAVLLDASHPNSIAYWLASHVWTLLLGVTILTFQLRQHKLDDYEGEYRLWFWMVGTCLLASLNSTTNASKLFGLALDHWAQLNLGWSGPAVVDATIATLIGMLGLRLCSELKAVPLSLVFWLFGLVSWAGSAALAQELLQVDMTIQYRFWLRSALWLGGLTCIWLAAITYLRSVYIEAQRRFLARGRLAQHSTPMAQRLREAMPSLPQFRRSAGDASEREAAGSDAPSRWAMHAWSLKKRSLGRQTEPSSEQSGDEASQGTQETWLERRGRTKREAAERKAALRQQREEERLLRKMEQEEVSEDEQSSANAPKRKWGFAPRKKEDQVPEDGDQQPKKSRLTGWLRAPKDSDDAEEFQKVPRHSKANQVDKGEKHASAAEAADQSTRRTWIPKLGRPKMPSLPKPNMGGLLSKFQLSGLRLQPPEDSEDSAEDQGPAEVQNRSLPSTEPASADAGDAPARPLTKAERKRMRRMQQKNRAA